MDEKQPLFEIEHTMTEEEYLQFNKEVKWKKWRKQALWVYGIYSLIVLIAGIIFYYLTQSPSIIYLAFVVFLCFAVIFMCQARSLRRKTQKVWESFPQMQRDEISVFRFYDDYLICESSSGTTRFEYSQIYNFFETPTHFYIMVSMIQGMILKKDALTEENAAFIRALAPKKKTRKRG